MIRGRGPVAALAGRRVDADGANPARFPRSAVPDVRAALLALFNQESPTALVCSAACGSDLIALKLANELDVLSYIVLPFADDKFKATSVVDRPGDWGPLYDEMIANARGRGTLIMLDETSDGDPAYSAATQHIVSVAKSLSGTTTPIAVAVSDSAPRETHDATDEFRQLALLQGFRLCDVRINSK